MFKISDSKGPPEGFSTAFIWMGHLSFLIRFRSQIAFLDLRILSGSFRWIPDFLTFSRMISQHLEKLRNLTIIMMMSYQYSLFDRNFFITWTSNMSCLQCPEKIHCDFWKISGWCFWDLEIPDYSILFVFQLSIILLRFLEFFRTMRLIFEKSLISAWWFLEFSRMMLLTSKKSLIFRLN